MTCAKRVANLMKTMELFESTFPTHVCQSGYLSGILIDLACTSDELYAKIDEKLRGLILWKTTCNLEDGAEDDPERLTY